MALGISIVICTHNGAHRLPETMAHLAAQQVPSGRQWEVLLVDNASTDGTSDVARSCWPAQASAPLRIVQEPNMGLSHARRRGFAEARYEMVSFIDDDNWVYPDWISVVSELMSAHPEVGACGGLNEAVADVDLPWWFSRFQRSYAVGPQEEETGDATWKKGVLFGAGLTIRKAAWEALHANGFSPLLVGRDGISLTCGEDYELCLALRLAGWRLWYEPGLKLKHYLPAYRLEWRYLRRLLRSAGAADIGLNAYYLTSFKNNDRWQRLFFSTAGKLLRHPISMIRAFLFACEGDINVLLVERKIGCLNALMHMRSNYDLMFVKVRHADWVKR